MPLGRAHVWHRLNDIIFRYHGLTETLSKLSHLLITPDKCFRVACFIVDGADDCLVGILDNGHVPLLFRVVLTGPAVPSPGIWLGNLSLSQPHRRGDASVHTPSCP